MYIAVLHPNNDDNYFAMLNGPSDEVVRWEDLEFAIENMASAPENYHEVFMTKIIQVPEIFTNVRDFTTEYLSQDFKDAGPSFGLIVVETNIGSFEDFGLGMDGEKMKPLYDAGIPLFSED